MYISASVISLLSDFWAYDSGLSSFSGIEAEKIQLVAIHLVVDDGLRGKTMSVPLLSYHREL
tara:strand:- start:4991 stop:5176 length:186 start_codon:yes stop_codon:yes gene_type:complete